MVSGGGMTPEGARRQQQVFRVVNVPMRGLLSLPLAIPISRRLMLAHYTARKSGKAYRQPVSHVEGGDTLLTPGAVEHGFRIVRWHLQAG
jgi:hypothetical protein